MRSKPLEDFNLLDLARISVTVITGASSKYRGRLFTFEAASTTLDHFSGPN